MRLPRIKIHGKDVVYHLNTRVRGNQLLLGEIEKEKLLLMAREHARFSEVEILAHCMMSSHFHLLVRVPGRVDLSDAELVQRIAEHYRENSQFRNLVEQTFKDSRGKLPRHMRRRVLVRLGDISSFMKELKQRYTKWYNKEQSCSGILWAERFRSAVIDDKPSVVAKVAAYIDLGPVRTGLVEDPGEYRWCGYAEAVAGDREAREKIASFSTGRGWRAAGASYRKLLFAKAGPKRKSIRKGQ